MPAPWNFHEAYYRVLRDLVDHGAYVAPRGLPTVELQDVVIELPGNTDDGIAVGRTSVRYFLAELAWYASRDPSVSFISKHASLWSKIQNPDGTANSNYGEKIWSRPRCDCLDTERGVSMAEHKVEHHHMTPNLAPSEWDWCVETLKADPASRQAIMVIHRPEHHWAGNKDVPCTLTISFTVRNGELQTRVHMRSSDAWFGLPYDVPFFLWLHRRMAKEIQVRRGMFRIALDSLHLYAHRGEHAARYLASWRPAESWVCPVPADLPLDRVENLCGELLKAQEATHV